MSTRRQNHGTSKTAPKNSAPDVTQAPATLHFGDAPQANVIYEWTNGAGAVSQYMMPTGERLKNGKHVVRFIDLMNRGQSRAYRVKARTYMDVAWFAQWRRALTVPGAVYHALTAASCK